MQPPKFPTNINDACDLADWLELKALTSADGNASAADLQCELKRLSQIKINELSLETFHELERRSHAAGADAYPFEIRASLLETKKHPRKHVAYIFCLCISFYGWKSVRNAPVNPWLLFEELSAVAARNFIKGDVCVFGTSQRRKRTGFRIAVDDLASKLGEGEGFKSQKTQCKDDKLDVVVWKKFPDTQRSNLVIFGQCAAGYKWEQKTRELDPDAFWRQWMKDSVVSHIMRSFFIPHRINPDIWDYHARRAGLFFDRCRISRFAQISAAKLLSDTRYLRWCRRVMGAALS